MQIYLNIALTCIGVLLLALLLTVMAPTRNFALSKAAQHVAMIFWGLAVAVIQTDPLCTILGSLWYGSYLVLMEFAIRPDRYDKEILEAFVTGFLSVLEIPDNADVRCALYLPIEKEKLIAATDYIGSEEPLHGKVLDFAKGIVGKAARLKDGRYLTLSATMTDNEYRDLLVNEYGFTMEEARRVNKERRAFIAVPVLDTRLKLLGIVYADAKDPAVLVGPHPDQTVDKAGRAAMLLGPLLEAMENRT